MMKNKAIFGLFLLLGIASASYNGNLTLNISHDGTLDTQANGSVINGSWFFVFNFTPKSSLSYNLSYSIDGVWRIFPDTKTAFHPFGAFAGSASGNGAGNVTGSGVAGYHVYWDNNTNLNNSGLYENASGYYFENELGGYSAYIVNATGNGLLFAVNSSNKTDFALYGASQGTSSVRPAARILTYDNTTGDYLVQTFRRSTGSSINYTDYIMSLYDASDGVFNEFFSVSVNDTGYSTVQFGRAQYIDSVSIGYSSTVPTTAFRRGLNIFSNTSFYDKVSIGGEDTTSSPFAVINSNTSLGKMADFYYFFDHSSGANLRVYKARGNITDPRRTRDGDVLGGINAFGYNATSNTVLATQASGANGQFQFVADDNFNSTARGTYFRLGLTPPDNDTVRDVFRIYGNTTVSIPASDNSSQWMCLNISQSGTVGAYKC
jgi:hypothetical protein